MKVIISGATGFIGKTLAKELVQNSYEVIALSRSVEKGKAAFDELGIDVQVVHWDARTGNGWVQYAEGADAIINLAGENLAGLWTETKKHKILESRVNSAAAVVDAVKRCIVKPKLVVQASAIGYYGHSPDHAYDEESPAGTGFLADVCIKWEKAILPVLQAGCRLVTIRTGIVLGAGGGMLGPIATAYKLFAGGCIGTGKQWLSWISLDDEIAAIRFLIENRGCSGPYNLVSIEPATMGQFCEDLAEVLNRPNWLKVPSFLVRIAAADLADELLVTGRKIVPKRLIDAGFKFKHTELESTISEILQTAQ
jgi:uncharacterized protein (TIGR01777 family)